MNIRQNNWHLHNWGSRRTRLMYTAYFWATKVSYKRLHEDQINHLIVWQHDNLHHYLTGEIPLILPVCIKLAHNLKSSNNTIQLDRPLSRKLSRVGLTVSTMSSVWALAFNRSIFYEDSHKSSCLKVIWLEVCDSEWPLLRSQWSQGF